MLYTYLKNETKNKFYYARAILLVTADTDHIPGSKLN